MRRHRFVLAALLLAASFAAPAADEERLLFVMPDKWQEYLSESVEGISTTEYVPEGQDNEDWHEMLTVQIMLAVNKLTAEQILSAIAHRAKKYCEGFDIQPIQLGGVGEYPSVAMMMLCGRNKQTGRGEFMLIRGIEGEDNFYILQKSWRVPVYDVTETTPIDLEDRRFWLGYLSYLRVCDTRKETCPAEE